MLNFRKKNAEIEKLESENSLLNEKLNNARSKLNEKEKIIEALKKTIEGLNLVINNLKTEKSKEFAIKTKNAKNWLHGYHGEGDVGGGE